jgi:hypothetical protein
MGEDQSQSRRCLAFQQFRPVEQRRRTKSTYRGWHNEQLDLVDQSRPEQRPVEAATPGQGLC